MVFGKVGRPAEDKLARQREIYEAVAPLIVSVGARRLSMREASRAACISIGGLYHYFPTKRDLVLHGLSYDARDRLCRDYRERIADLTGWGLSRYLDAYLDHSLKMFAFIRPSIQAALDSLGAPNEDFVHTALKATCGRRAFRFTWLELGAAEFQEALDAGLAANVGELVESLRQVVPGAAGCDLAALARAIRRVVLGALIDRQANLDETRQQLRMLIEGYAAGVGQAALARPQAV